MVDTHVSKMVLESAQMLATCFTLEQLAAPGCPRNKKGSPRKHGYYNHPCTKWTRISKSNMSWLISHALAMDDERRRRKCAKHPSLAIEDIPAHFCVPFIHWCSLHIHQSVVPDGEITEFAQAMPIEFKCDDSVEAYRKLYKEGKKHLHKWTLNRPNWIDVLN